MKTTHAALILAPLLLGNSPLWAQHTPAVDTRANAAEASMAAPPLRIGDATRSLLAQQRQGSQASAVDRPIDGSVAALSHQRYLQSFERPVPEWFRSRMGDTKSGGASQ